MIQIGCEQIWGFTLVNCRPQRSILVWHESALLRDWLCYFTMFSISTLINAPHLSTDETFGLHRNTAKNSDMNKWKEAVFSSISPCHSIPISNFVIINSLQTNMQIPPVVEAITEPRPSPIRRSGYYSAASDASVGPRIPTIIILITEVSLRSCESPFHRSSPCIWSPTGLTRLDIFTFYSCWISRAVTGGCSSTSSANRALQRPHMSTNQKLRDRTVYHFIQTDQNAIYTRCTVVLRVWGGFAPTSVKRHNCFTYERTKTNQPTSHPESSVLSCARKKNCYTRFLMAEFKAASWRQCQTL